MEDQENKSLFDRMSAENTGIDAPPLHVMQAARQAMMRRKAPAQREDVLALLAAFLNMKIKLYHAVLASIAIGGAILYFSGSDSGRNNEARLSSFESNIAAVANQTLATAGTSIKNSTVLCSINTFITRK